MASSERSGTQRDECGGRAAASTAPLPDVRGPLPRAVRTAVGPRAPASLRGLRWGFGLVVVVAFPASAVAVFGGGVDRHLAADALSICFGFGLALLFSTAFWPLSALRAWSREDRFASASLLFLAVSYATHLSWELGWLLLFPRIRTHPDALWAYPWWAYIDGGDARYLRGAPEVVGMEILSVLNGTVGACALFAHLRSGGTSRRAVLVMMGTAVIHFYSASFYYLSEIVGGLPNVDTSRFVNLWIKFGLANAPWVVMPWVVLAWGARALDRLPRPSTAPTG